MASIRITKKIREKIERNARDLFYDAQTNVREKLPVDFWDRCVNYLLSTDDYRPFVDMNLIENISTKWVTNIETVDVHFNSTANATLFNIRLINKYKIVKVADMFSVSEFVINFKDLNPSLQLEYNNWNAELHEILQEQNEFIKKLNKVLDNCTTINQFQKVWPQSEHLLKGVLEESTNLRQKRKRKKIEIEQDTINVLNSTLLKRTILNS